MRYLIITLLLVGLPVYAAAPSQDNPVAATSNLPAGAIEITADTALEWVQNEKAYIARGNAVAVRGDVRLEADMLRALYSEASDGSPDITEIIAEGKVRIIRRNPDGSSTVASGDKGTYSVADEIAVLRGENLKLVLPRGTLTATDKLEYQSRAKRAIATGNAVLQGKDQRRITADRISADFTPDAAGNLQLKEAQAEGNVVVITQRDIARAKRGTYNPEQQIATLSGNVQITSGDNQLHGDRAEINLGNGQSRMLAEKGGRVRGLLVPNRSPSGASK